jgi:signal peptidase I
VKGARPRRRSRSAHGRCCESRVEVFLLGLVTVFLRVLKSWWGFLGLCVLAALLVRIWVISGYTIPTGSMEPTLHGDKEEGDRVAVFKLYYHLFDPERLDMVVFEVPPGEGGAPGPGEERVDGSTTMVKRVVAFSGETVRIGDGDLFIGRAGDGGSQGENGLERFKKTLPLVQSLLIPVYRACFVPSFFDDWVCYRIEENDLQLDSEAVEKCWTLSGDSLVCNGAHPEFSGRRVALTFASEIADSYLDDKGLFHAGACTVGDLSLTVECEILEDGGGAVCCELHEGTDSFSFELFTRTAGGGGRVTHPYGDPSVRTIDAGLFPGLEPGRRTTIQCLNVDNRVALFCDGVLLTEFDYRENRAFSSTALYNSPTFGAKGLKVAFHDVRIDRDIHYIDTGGVGCGGRSFTLPRDSCFVLGDNSSESSDSRMMGPVKVAWIVGRPFFIFYPFGRMRFL